MLVFGLLFIHLVLGSIGNWAESKNTIKAAGIFGVIDAAIAIYTAGAIVINESYLKVILPLGAKGQSLGDPIKPKHE